MKLTVEEELIEIIKDNLFLSYSDLGYDETKDQIARCIARGLMKVYEFDPKEISTKKELDPWEV